jgi:hypothetical protein
MLIASEKRGRFVAGFTFVWKRMMDRDEMFRGERFVNLKEERNFLSSLRLSFQPMKRQQEEDERTTSRS